jgi:LAO/AO transport system kinase
VPESSLASDAASGDRRALARLISLIEADPGDFDSSERGAGRIVGITGPPGVGKSTLVNSLVDHLRSRDESVAVVAVDPSSPITGGALLGDRIRMQGHIDDDGVFVRSMSARGHLGGLSVAARPVIHLLTRSGFDYVLVETVGVGQSEVEVMGVADLVVLVVAPGWGDQIQADKAGIAEIAGLFVINKCDRSGSADVERALMEANHQSHRPIVKTVATTGDGVGDLLTQIDELFSAG